MKDSATLHFLKHFPAQYLLLLLFFIIFFFYVQTHDAFLQRLVDTVLGAILGMVTGKWLPHTSSGDVFMSEDNLQNLTDGESDNAVKNNEEK